MPTVYAGANTYPASLTIPSDGDGPPKAADVNVTFEGLGDRTTWLKNRLAPFSAIGSGSGLVYSWSAPGNTGLFAWQTSTITLDVTGCLVGDKLFLQFSTNIQLVGNSNTVRELRFLATDDFGGAGVDTILASHCGVLGDDNDRFGGVSIVEAHTVLNAGTTRFQLQAGFVNSTGQGMRLYTSWAVNVLKVRP